MQKVSPIWRAREEEGARRRSSHRSQQRRRLPRDFAVADNADDRADRPRDRPRDLGGDAESIFSSRSNGGDQRLHYARCQSGRRRWDVFVVDDASVPVFLRIANLFKRPALIRIQEAKREEEGRQEGGIHPRPGLASFVVLGAAAGSRES